MRAFMSMHTTLVLIGVNIPGSGLLREGRHDPRTRQWMFPPPTGTAASTASNRAGDDPATQTERRFDLIHLEPFRYDTPQSIAAWTAHLAGLEQHLRLFHARAGMLTGATMTLISFADRYPPVNPEFSGRHRQNHGLFVKENWVFSRASRYCPECLAGDGSPIHNRHGGAWRLVWRLPVTFALDRSRSGRHSVVDCR
jgi:hypothetical protein